MRNFLLWIEDLEKYVTCDFYFSEGKVRFSKVERSFEETELLLRC